MKRAVVFAMMIGLVCAPSAFAQSEGSKTLAATMSVYVFPTEGQSAEQQSKDEAECYNWAVGNTGTDPFDLAKQSEQQLQILRRREETRRTAVLELAKVLEGLTVEIPAKAVWISDCFDIVEDRLILHSPVVVDRLGEREPDQGGHFRRLPDLPVFSLPDLLRHEADHC